ncbi:transcriptional regulator [Neorhizobium lilium]|uniref:Transcriptional regulator n=1 Tax=Neorhizobium lilium TaxID=2503024 RepID=A0A3S3RKG0_9HYPH|nr:transcriptional regulator [Neorhizobium lilium]RWX78532.1 transcriptional regulator [Neorhizobium lilium]
MGKPDEAENLILLIWRKARPVPSRYKTLTDYRFWILFVSPPTIIVIAADAGLRDSLVFALEVEGYRVEAHDSWQGCSARGEPCLCMILDGDLVANRRCLLEHMPLDGGDLILLTDGLSPVPKDLRADILTKPFAGGDLLRLVKNLPRMACPA